MQSEVIAEAVAKPGASVTPEQVREVVARACPVGNYVGKRVLIIVPDATRTAPVGLLFKSLYAQVGAACAACDVMFALGTHPPMSEEAMDARLEISASQRQEEYGRVRFFNHEWDNPEALTTVGTISADEIGTLTSGRFAMEVEVRLNRRLFDYDQTHVLTALASYDLG